MARTASANVTVMINKVGPQGSTRWMVTEIGYNGLVLKTCVSANEPTWGFESLTIRQNPLGWPESSATAPCACSHEERYINEYGPLGTW